MPKAEQEGRELGPDAEESVHVAEEGGQSARQGGGDDLESLRRERDDLLSKWRRAQADYQNLKRRSTADFEAISRRSMQPLLEELLLVLDHLDMALTSPATGEEAKNIAAGVKLTRDQFMRVLEQEQVAPVPEEGLFDPALHQAVGTVADTDAEPGTIVQTVRRGYTWREGVLRHAQVLVAAGDAEEAEAGTGEDERSAGSEA